MKCHECEQEVTSLYDDPRTPPLKLQACLCWDCFQSALGDVKQDFWQQSDFWDEYTKDQRGSSDD
jgi:hypothetical protein